MSIASQPSRVQILGVGVDVVTMETALAWADSQVGRQARHTILAVNPEKVIEIKRNSILRGLFENASLLIPDGIGVVVAARLSRRMKAISRVPGCELMPLICGIAVKRGCGVFVYGASEEVNASAVAVLSKRYPGLRISGRQNGYLPDAEMPSLIERINSSGADILFVGLGSPRQELWMEKYLPQLRVSLCQGVGGTLDVLAGRVQRAPEVFRRAHLEWAYRLLSQPSRIFRQTALVRFAGLIFVDSIRSRWRPEAAGPR